jgi:hypothetical protein
MPADPGRIFISYRRGDEPGFALALYTRLEQAFSAEQLFMDVEGGIPAGHDFVHVLENEVDQCDVLLALIGQRWLTATDDRGTPRLQNAHDFVRIEIESAMRLGKRVIPVLINKTEMPRTAELPETLQPLARRNAVRLTHERFKADTQGLVVAINRALEESSVLARAQEEAAQEKERAQLAALAELSPEQIAKAEELANWDLIKANASPNVQDFRNHIVRFPGGVTERFARARLEDLVWVELRRKIPTIDQLNKFLAEFPEGTHASEAANRIAVLEQKEAEAREAARRRRETAAWKAARDASDKEAALKAFLKEWPQSRHADAAQLLIEKLRQAEIDDLQHPGNGFRRWMITRARDVDEPLE